MADGVGAASKSSLKAANADAPGPSSSLLMPAAVKVEQPTSPKKMKSVCKRSPKASSAGSTTQRNTTATPSRKGAKRKDRTDRTDTGSRKAVKIFSKDTLEYKELLEIVATNDWTERLPTTKTSKELSDFMEKTGFSRAQIVRKFNELQRWRWINTKEAIKEKQKDLERNPTQPAGTAENNSEEEEPKVKNLKPDSTVSREDHTAIEKDNTEKTDVPQDSNLFSFPTTRTNDAPLQPGFLTLFSNPPIMLRQNSSVGLSPLRSRQFHEVTPFSYHPITMESLVPSWSSSSLVPPPPNLLRIQTAEEEALLKGSIMRDPDHDPQLPFQQLNTPHQVSGWSRGNEYDQPGLYQGYVEPHHQSYYHGHDDIYGLDRPSISHNEAGESSTRQGFSPPRRRNSFVYRPDQTEGQDLLQRALRELFAPDFLPSI